MCVGLEPGANFKVVLLEKRSCFYGFYLAQTALLTTALRKSLTLTRKWLCLRLRNKRLRNYTCRPLCFHVN